MKKKKSYKIEANYIIGGFNEKNFNVGYIRSIEYHVVC